MTAEEILRALITEFDIGCYVYDVKEREGNGWHGPLVERFTFLIGEAEKLVQ